MLASADQLLQLAVLVLRQAPRSDRLGQPAPHSDTFAMFLVACNRMTVAESSRVLPDEAAHPHLAYGARGQPPAFNPDAYRHRDQVERGSNRRKHGRGLVTRNDKLGIN
jgi:hypothetical protein